MKESVNIANLKTIQKIIEILEDHNQRHIRSPIVDLKINVSDNPSTNDMFDVSYKTHFIL